MSQNPFATFSTTNQTAPHIAHNTIHNLMFAKHEGGKGYNSGGDRRVSAYLAPFATIFFFSCATAVCDQTILLRSSYEEPLRVG